VQGIMAKAQKNRASKQKYISPTQLTFVGFESPFTRSLKSDNRWVVLAHNIPWDDLASVYQSQLGNGSTGASGINPRVAMGALIIKHKCNLSDRETIQQIQENMYMQYFIGYSSYCEEEPFDPSLFVDIRKRLGVDQVNKINEQILGLSRNDDDSHSSDNITKIEDEPSNDEEYKKGKLLMDATACPQDIAYPTDLNLLNDAREKSEELIDLLYNIETHIKKPRTYRQVARKYYLHTAQKKTKTKKELRKAIKKQLAFLGRNLSHINQLLESYQQIPLEKAEYKYLLVIQILYDQQMHMFINNTHSIEHRIVSIHQPHVRPIVRGKANAKVEFGAKIHIAMIDGYAFLDKLSWEAYNEGGCLQVSVLNYKKRFGFYPQEVLADKIYCNRENRRWLKEKGIVLRAKPLGRPKAEEPNLVSPGERNPVEAKFGQAKTAYGMNRIKARLQETSESWIATIILVLNLVKLAGEVPCAINNALFTFSITMSVIERAVKIILWNIFKNNQRSAALT
jgi:hypothetical protein